MNPLQFKKFSDRVHDPKYIKDNTKTGKYLLEDIQEYLKDKNIILVGNSSKILKQDYGEFIDSHEIIIRINLGFNEDKKIKHIGSKTHIWVSGLFNPVMQKKGYKFFNVDIIILMSAHVHYNQEDFMVKNAYCNTMESYLRILDNLGEKPSTGFMTLDFLTRNIKFKSLSMIGFDFFHSPTWYNQPNYVTPHNTLNREENESKRLIEKYNINFIDMDKKNINKKKRIKNEI